jgi:hypothetical protein
MKIDDHDNTEKFKKKLEIWIKTYNINFEKLKLYRDFSLMLFDLIEETYLGVDVMEDETDQENHFKWCWGRVVKNFTKEKIYFKEFGDHYQYYLLFFLEAYYMSKLNNKEYKIPEYLETLFDLTTIKSNSELDLIVEVYKILDNNLKK